MRFSPVILRAVTSALILAGAASAQQFIPPGASQFNPPPTPPPPPPPNIEPPVIPQMDAPLPQNYAPAPRPSFSDRISKCLDDAAASGLGPGERDAYSRSCANR